MSRCPFLIVLPVSIALAALVTSATAAQEVPKVTIRTVPSGTAQPGQAPKRPATPRRVTQKSSSSRPASTRPRTERRAPTRRSAQVAKKRDRTPERVAARTREREPEKRVVSKVPPRRRSAAVVRNEQDRSTTRGAQASTRLDAREVGPITLNNEGYRLLRRGRFAEAEPTLRKAIALKPSQPTYAYALYNLGWSLMGQGRISEAIEPLRRSAAMQPGRREPKQKLAEAYELLGRDGKGEARDRASQRTSVRTSGRTRRSRRPRTDDTRAAAPGVGTVRLVGDAWVGSTRSGEDQGLRAEREARRTRFGLRVADLELRPEEGPSEP